MTKLSFTTEHTSGDTRVFDYIPASCQSDGPLLHATPLHLLMVFVRSRLGYGRRRYDARRQAVYGLPMSARSMGLFHGWLLPKTKCRLHE